MKKNLVLLIALWLIAVIVAAPVTAGECVVPPDEYFITDGPHNGQPVHGGLQLEHVWWITEEQRIEAFSGSVFLGLTEYKLKQSHKEQEDLAFAYYAYCHSVPDFPYDPNFPNRWGAHVSEDPYDSEYLSTQEMRARDVPV